jgi:hypothetical protein
MLLHKELAMKTLLIIFALLLALNANSAVEEKRSDLKFSELGLQLSLETSADKRVVERVSLLISNASARDGKLRLPSPFSATYNPTSSFALFPPWLGLLVKDPKSGTEEQFALTTFVRVRRPGKVITLSKGQTKRIDYRSTSFYRWGPGNPDRYGSFKEYFKPGSIELEVRAVLFWEADADCVLSNRRTFRCSFPEWLFKETSKRDALPRKPEEDRVQ